MWVTKQRLFEMMVEQLNFVLNVKLPIVSWEMYDIPDTQLNSVLQDVVGCSLDDLYGDVEFVLETVCNITYDCPAIVIYTVFCRLLNADKVFFILERGAGILLSVEEMEKRATLFVHYDNKRFKKALLLSTLCDIDGAGEISDRELNTLSALLMFAPMCGVTYGQTLIAYYGSRVPISQLLSANYNVDDLHLVLIGDEDLIEAGKRGAEAVKTFLKYDEE